MTSTRARSARFVTLVSAAILGTGWLAACGSSDAPETTAGTTAGTGGSAAMGTGGSAAPGTGATGGSGGSAACDAGFGDCNLDATDGCEVDLQSDGTNCGSCGKACGATSVCNAGACAVCQLNVLAKADFATGPKPIFVTTGDFNGDGKLDLASANNLSVGDNTVSVLLGNGDGSFQPTKDAKKVVPVPSSSVTTGDFNGDGKLDLATANPIGVSAHTVGVLLGFGDGSFQPTKEFATGTKPSSVTTGDFNGDGKLDLATANENSNNVSVLLGNGDGSFQPKKDFASLAGPISVTTGDFNGDGKLDLASANINSVSVGVLLGNGDGTFQAKKDFATGPSPFSVTAGDFNGDGKLDLATANADGDNVSVLLGNGDGSFQPKKDFMTGSFPLSVTAADFNGDGKLDLASANSGDNTNTLSVLLGNGDGSFQPKSDFATGSYPISVTTGDFNGDGKPDLASANNGNDTLSVLLNGACLP
jgi:hypothetical protein